LGDDKGGKGNAEDHGEELALVSDQHFERYEIHNGSVLGNEG
jgi:hypothetical protein